MNDALLIFLVIIVSFISALLFINANNNFIGKNNNPFMILFIYAMFFLMLYTVIGGVVFMLIKT